jgi:hypothetical protein
MKIYLLWILLVKSIKLPKLNNNGYVDLMNKDIIPINPGESRMKIYLIWSLLRKSTKILKLNNNGYNDFMDKVIIPINPDETERKYST